MAGGDGMNYLSLCSGIEAATQAFAPLGWNPVAFSEIEPFPCAVLKHHYPDVPNWGDMTQFKDWPDAAVDLLCGGTPCQSFSVAGLRQGLADPRGNLMLTYLAIARRYRPRWLVWENVPGVLSSNGGRDFGTFLGGLGELGYGFAYRVLDAQHVRTRRFPFAVPQRRRRVFVVGYLGDWARAAAVLFDRESLSGHPPPGRKAGQTTSHDVAGSLVSSGRGVERAGDTRGQDPVIGIQSNSGDVGYCLTASAQGSLDAETETLLAVAHPLRGEGFDAGEDGTGRGTPLVPVAWSIMPQNSGKDYKARKVDVAQPLMAGGPVGGNQGGDFIQVPGSYGLSTQQEPKWQEDVAPSLALPSKSGGGQTTAVAFAQNQRGELRTSDIAMQLTAGGGKPGEGYPAVMTPWAVRRLTPEECEKLQAFPPGFTRIPYRGKPADKCPDGPRYKAIGNSWAVNCAAWIGEMIAEIDGQKEGAAA